MKTLINFYKLVDTAAFCLFFSPFADISCERPVLTSLFIFSINNTSHDTASHRIVLITHQISTKKVIIMSSTFRLNRLLIIALTARGGLVAESMR
ncbi:hypothetical protein AYY18_08435 [Morganella psychrotolerans]|uniref:Uncharacterized protein n=1 Tax=Morganella psychrotolerans TaxID=368603 RepID=A0A1B8H7Q4_9GAMM|nr:hypothetical protein AYY18_08435 [Morganella psychrotolerans]